MDELDEHGIGTTPVDLAQSAKDAKFFVGHAHVILVCGAGDKCGHVTTGAISHMQSGDHQAIQAVHLHDVPQKFGRKWQ